jgi:hypothetical protein
VNKFGSFKKYEEEWPAGDAALDSPMRRVLTIALWAVIHAAAAAAAIHPEALAAVERIRGHAFLHPVSTVTISRADLPRILHQRLESGSYPPAEDYITALRALELIGDPDKAIEGMIALYASQVMAFYDLDEHRYYAIDSPPPGLSKELAAAPIMTRAIEVHELTHAMQDQLFGAGARAERLRFDWDAQLAYQSVLEGEATLVMLAWMGESSGLSLDQMLASDTIVEALAAQASALGTGGGGERYFAESLTFPYVSGLRFVAAAYKRGGWAAVDAVDSNPPATTAEIQDPASYSPAAHEPASQAAAPPDPLGYSTGPAGPAPQPPSSSPLLRTHLGMFNWRFLLGDLPPGYRGDLTVVLQDERCQTTVLTESQWASEESARKFADSYLRFLEGRGIGARSSQHGTAVRLGYGSDRGAIASFIRYESHF